MTMYALVKDGQVVSTWGTPPPIARRLDTGEWVAPNQGAWTDALLAQCGILPVAVVARPADTTTTAYDYKVDLVSGVPTEVYTPRAKTAAEQAADAAQAVRTTLLADSTADLSKLDAAIAQLGVLLSDAATAGSIRQTMGRTTDPAGVTSLRAWKSQTAANIVTSASLKGLADLLIAVCQRQIDVAQATRKVARQVARNARLSTGTLTSADVGADI